MEDGFEWEKPPNHEPSAISHFALYIILGTLLSRAILITFMDFYLQKSANPPGIQELDSKIARLKEEVSKLRLIDDFVEKSRKERAIIALEKDRDQIVKKQIESTFLLVQNLKRMRSWISSGFPITLMLVFWSAPVITAHTSSLSPFSWFFSESEKMNQITIHGFYFTLLTFAASIAITSIIQNSLKVYKLRALKVPSIQLTTNEPETVETEKQKED